LEDFEPPAGGCLLTEIQFSNKLRDFVSKDTLNIEDIDTLKAGRHLRLPDGAKLVIGRNQEDNEKLKSTQSSKYLKGRILDASGPFCLIQKDISDSDKKLAGDIIVTYGKTDMDKVYEVDFEEFKIDGKRLPSKDEIQKYFVQ
jgi:tRNA-specific 2-thiouridylase